MISLPSLTLLLFILSSPQLVYPQVELEDQVGNDCKPTFCPLQILKKEVNGVKLEFHPCCMVCGSCNDVYDPVCVLKDECKGEKCEEKFTTMTNPCHACLSPNVGSYAMTACPEPGATGSTVYEQAMDAILSYVEQVSEIAEGKTDDGQDWFEDAFGQEVDVPGEVSFDDWKKDVFKYYKGDDLLMSDLYDDEEELL